MLWAISAHAHQGDDRSPRGRPGAKSWRPGCPQRHAGDIEQHIGRLVEGDTLEHRLDNLHNSIAGYRAAAGSAAPPGDDRAAQLTHDIGQRPLALVGAVESPSTSPAR